MSARSFLVKGSGGGTMGLESTRGGDGILEGARELVGGPGVVVDDGHDVSRPIDHRGPQVVGDRAVLLANDVDAERRRKSIDDRLVGGCEPPDGGSAPTVFACARSTAARSNFGSKLIDSSFTLPGERRIARRELLHLGESPIDERAELS